MFGIGEGELVIILVFGFLLFGPDKLPQMGHTIGRALRQFRETQQMMTSVVQSEIIDPVTEAASAPVKPKKAVAADEDDSDVDVDGDDSSAPAKKETFAERRARLAAEKAAQEAGAEGEKAADAVESAPATVDAAESVAEEAASEEAPAEESAANEVKTTEDLYAPRSRSRRARKEALLAELEAASDAAESENAAEGGDE